MKKVICAFILITMLVNTGCKRFDVDHKNGINPIIGDRSFINKFGHRPGTLTDEDLRIKTHLEYVENLLRHKVTPVLSPALVANRLRLLDLLHKYRQAEFFRGITITKKFGCLVSSIKTREYVLLAI